MKMGLCLLALATLLPRPIVTAAQGSLQPRAVTLSDPSRPGTLELTVQRGSVDVVASARADILIEVVRSQTAPPSGGRTLDVRDVFDIQERHNIVAVVGREAARMDIRVHVPTRINLKLRKTADARPASSAGAVAVHGVAGNLEVETLAGDIVLTDVSGSVVAHSRHGRVAVTLVRVSPDRPMAFTSYDGHIDVTLPASTKAKLNLHSARSAVFTDFNLAAHEKVPPAADARRSGRRSSGRSITAALNGGGPQFELRSYLGHVFLRKGP